MKFDLKKKNNLKPISHFYFLNSHISLIIEITIINCYTGVKNIHMEETVSHILFLGLGFYFI